MNRESDEECLKLIAEIREPDRGRPQWSEIDRLLDNPSEGAQEADPPERLKPSLLPVDHRRMIDTVTDEPRREEAPPQNTMKLSVNVAHEIGNRLRKLAFDRRVSESSIVEVALQALYADREDHELAHVLREGGATLRRKRGAA